MSVDETALRELVETVGKAWAANDGDAFADAYTEDATLTLSGDRFFAGREVIRAVLTQQFATAHKGTTLLQNITKVRPLGRDAAFVITEGGVLAPGETVPAPERAFRAIWVMVKEENTWLIAAYQNTRTADTTLPGA
ncbi:conserved hypothetical protein [Amycolatopsis xylanica]|uniref:DUF4440 domain-containing protein n=1 Tax=Amycolatopsis xylanica TaxID=589385 RepID=A0A1H3DAD6_9PSEU|nr:SgcJ/EcaC family oxidoreductase [Amycolatopsis xylanica]SDX62704.1 conserved hypothetical protein [Amycolatopsis xylanica]